MAEHSSRIFIALWSSAGDKVQGVEHATESALWLANHVVIGHTLWIGYARFSFAAPGPQLIDHTQYSSVD